MTTPKKAKYQLRNRTVLVPNSAGGFDSLPGTPLSGDRLNTSIPEQEGSGLLSDETMPTEMLEEKTEALTEEIKKLTVCETMLLCTQNVKTLVDHSVLVVLLPITLVSFNSDSHMFWYLDVMLSLI